MKSLRFGLIGIGGIGEVHLKMIKALTEQGKVELVAVCDKYLARYSENLDKLGFLSTHRYEELDDFLYSGENMDLVIISTPIPLHRDMCCKVMKAGYDVLLEKPPAVTIQDLDDMIKVKKETKRFCAVGFQHTSEQSFVYFKDKIMQGEIGEVQFICAQGIWTRDTGYFSRTPWAGKLMLQGNYVLDGTVNNPFAHALNNCLILADIKENGSSPKWVQGELYHANLIEAEDTSCVRIKTENEVEILFVTTLCSKDTETPYIRVEGSKGIGCWDYDGNVTFRNYEDEENYESVQIESDAFHDMYDNIIEFKNKNIDKINCSLEDTRKFVLTSNLAFQSSFEISAIHEKDKEVYEMEGVPLVTIKDINDIVHRAAEEKKLFSELSIGWSKKTELVYAEGYHKFSLYEDA